jgi:hypothetical protein
MPAFHTLVDDWSTGIRADAVANRAIELRSSQKRVISRGQYECANPDPICEAHFLAA